MRIKLEPQEVLIIAQQFKGNGPSGTRYTLMTHKGSRHFPDFEKLLKALREHYKVPKESA